MAVQGSEDTMQRVIDREEGREIKRGSLIDELGDHEISVESNWDMIHYRVTGYINEPDTFFVEIHAEDALGEAQFCISYEGGGLWSRDDSNGEQLELEDMLMQNLEGASVPQKKQEREVVFCKVLIEKAIPLIHMMRKDLLGE